jgi:hypothetical protein|tara:strand:- start:90 stop:356 length:267 start_codon:yes stop_codon:yes gene_type:complete
MGWEPKEEDLPQDGSNLSLECQQALTILNALPDNWEGMNGTWLGKDYSGLSAVMDIYEIESRREVFELLKEAESMLGKYYAQQTKSRK